MPIRQNKLWWKSADQRKDLSLTWRQVQKTFHYRQPCAMSPFHLHRYPLLEEYQLVMAWTQRQRPAFVEHLYSWKQSRKALAEFHKQLFADANRVWFYLPTIHPAQDIHSLSLHLLLQQPRAFAPATYQRTHVANQESLDTQTSSHAKPRPRL